MYLYLYLYFEVVEIGRELLVGQVRVLSQDVSRQVVVLVLAVEQFSFLVFSFIVLFPYLAVEQQ